MITHDQFIFALKTDYPALVHGVDYWVGHEIDDAGQIADARIYAWNPKNISQPDQATIIARATALLPLFSPPPTLDDLKAAKLATINAAFDQAATALTDGYPPAERLTWPIQQAEAQAWAANNTAPTPYLDGIAAARGIDPAEMRQKTLDQANLFVQASQQLVGTRQKLRDAITAAQTPPDLDSINWPTAA